jgi:MFS family permease
MQPFTRGLWRSPDFVRVWTGQAISLLGSQIGGGALRYMAILMLGATPAQLSLLAAAGRLPVLLLVLPAGVWVDRVRRRPLLIGVDIGRGLLLLSVPLAALLGLLRMEQLYAVAALVGSLAMLFDTAYPAYVPTLVRHTELTEANSKLGLSESLAEIAGPPLGGALVQLLTAPLAIVLDALSFLISAAALGAVQRSERPLPAVARPDLRAELVAGLAAIRTQPLLRALLGIAVLQNLAGGIIGTLYDVYLIRELGLTPALVGLTVGAGGVGALMGALLAEAVVRRLGPGTTLVCSGLLGTLAGLLLPLASGRWAFATLLVMQLADVVLMIFSITALSLRQAATPNPLRGRVNASFSLLTTGAGLVGVLAAGVLAPTIGVRAALAIAVIIGVGALLWLLGSPLRALPTMPEEEPVSR